MKPIKSHCHSRMSEIPQFLTLNRASFDETRHAMVLMSMDAVAQSGFKRLSICIQKPLSGE
jgi:hypothetical protein